MPPNRNNEHRAAEGWAFIIRILAAVLHAYTQAFTHLLKITRLNRYLRTRQAILNGEKLFYLSGEELKTRKLMGPLTLNLYKAALASFPPIVAGWLISWHQQVELNNSGASAQLASGFWTTVLFQWQIVKTLQYTAAAFVVPAVPLVVALLVNWAYLHRVDWKPAIRQRSRRAFLYLDAAYGLLPQMFFSAALVLYVKHNWVSEQVGEDTYYAFNFLMGLPLIVAGLWPGYVFFFQIPRLLFDLNGYGEPDGIISATARLPRPWIQSVFGSAVTMVLVASLVKLALPGYSVPLPPPSGPFAVGRVAYDWIDATRVETLSSDGKGKSREIMVYVWYPASPPKPGTPAAPYFPDAGKIDQTPFAALEKTIWGSAWPMIATGRVHTRIYENVPVASGDRPFPLIIFSPGFYSEPFGYTHQIEELVSRGYVVATIHHAYEAGVATFPDGRILPFPDDKYWRSSISPFSFESIKWKDERLGAWAADILFTLDQIIRLNADPHAKPPFPGGIDVSRVGVFGHAFGGLAAARACQFDQRIRACLNQDGMTMISGPIRRFSDRRMPTQPFMFLHGLSEPPSKQFAREFEDGTEDQRKSAQGLLLVYQLRDPDPTTAKELEDMVDEKLQACTGNAYEVRIPGYIHSDFTDRAFLQAPGSALETATALKSQRIAESYTNAFFDKFLNGIQDTLVDREPSINSGVQIRRYLHQ